MLSHPHAKYDGIFTKAIESPKLSYDANLIGIFNQNACFFLHLVEGNRKTKKISLSSKTSQGEDTWTLGIGHRELIIYPIDSNGDSLVLDSLFCISEYIMP